MKFIVVPDFFSRHLSRITRHRYEVFVRCWKWRTEIGCLSWFCSRTIGVKTRHAAVTPRGKEVVEPEVVATSPCRLKSPMLVCCGFDSSKE
jgi:hypothetical protein